MQRQIDYSAIFHGINMLPMFIYLLLIGKILSAQAYQATKDELTCFAD